MSKKTSAAKKKRNPTTNEGRAERIRDFVHSEFASMSARLSGLSSEFSSLAEAMGAESINAVRVDGADKPRRAIDLLESFCVDAQASLKLAKMRRVADL